MQDQNGQSINYICLHIIWNLPQIYLEEKLAIEVLLQHSKGEIFLLQFMCLLKFLQAGFSINFTEEASSGVFSSTNVSIT